MPTLVDAEEHEVAATPKHGGVGRLALDCPALRDPTADGTVEATLTLLDRDSSIPTSSTATAARQHHYQQHDHTKSEDPEQHPDPRRGVVYIRP
jgi:hypothetical protein